MSMPPGLVGDRGVSSSGNRSVRSTLIVVGGTFNDPFGYGSAVSLNVVVTPRNETRFAAAGFADAHERAG